MFKNIFKIVLTEYVIGFNIRYKLIRRLEMNDFFAVMFEGAKLVEEVRITSEEVRIAERKALDLNASNCHAKHTKTFKTKREKAKKAYNDFVELKKLYDAQK